MNRIHSRIEACLPMTSRKIVFNSCSNNNSEVCGSL